MLHHHYPFIPFGRLVMKHHHYPFIPCVLFRKIEISSGIPTVYFNCKYFTLHADYKDASSRAMIYNI